MRVSTRVEYGMLALADIALYSENGASVSAPEIAERQRISQKYLEQILTQLKQAGLIRAQKGLRGGYTLAKTAEKTGLTEILDALDTGILEEMGAEEDEGGKSLRGAMTDCLWKKMNRTLVEFAESRTLADILQECRKRSAEWDMYVI